MSDDSDGGRWLTYAQLAELRGITRKAAIRMTHRHRWRRQPGNDGMALVLVPHDALAKLPRQTAMAAAAAAGDDDIPGKSLLAGALAALEDAVTGLRDHLADATARAERAEAAVADERARADRAEAAVSGERQRADGLRDRLIGREAELSLAQAAAERARADAQEALQRAEALEQAERALKARGRWARLRAAWRGE